MDHASDRGAGGDIMADDRFRDDGLGNSLDLYVFDMNEFVLTWHSRETYGGKCDSKRQKV